MKYKIIESVLVRQTVTTIVEAESKDEALEMFVGSNDTSETNIDSNEVLDIKVIDYIEEPDLTIFD